MNPSEYRLEFICKLSIAKNKGFDPNLLLTQATLETGNFNSALVKVNNCFGIKPWRNWKGGVTEHDTFEYENGKKIFVKDGFIKLPDITSGVNIMCVLVEKYHPLSWANRNNLDYFKHMASWSTSPTYSADLLKLYESLGWEGRLI